MLPQCCCWGCFAGQFLELVYGSAQHIICLLHTSCYWAAPPVLGGMISAVIFALFWLLVFRKLTAKHTLRILGYEQKLQPIYRFFDRKSFLLMAVMITLGIAVRAFALLPLAEIAVFYTGLGAALLLAGLVFLKSYILALQNA